MNVFSLNIMLNREATVLLCEIHWCCLVTLLMYYYFITIDTGVLIQERKRPRKLSHKVLECTIEEVSVAPTKKKVREDCVCTILVSIFF